MNTPDTGSVAVSLGAAPAGGRPRQRNGLTLLQLLAILSALALLFALVAPMILGAREAARRHECRNHLKQIGLALHNYEASYRTYPPGYHSYGDDSADAGSFDGPTGFGWGMLIIPYIDANPYYNRLDLGVPCWDPRNVPHVKVTIPVYLCPSARGDTEPFAVAGEPAGAAPVTSLISRSHYVANAGQAAPWRGSPPVADWSGMATGPFYRNSRIRIEDIEDGLSNTVFLGEHAGVSDRTWVGVVPGARVCPHDATHGVCEPAAALVLVSSGPDAEDSEIRTPNAIPPQVNQFYSAHEAGSYVLLGDGTVRFISSSISPATWAALVTCAGRDDTGDF